MSRGDKLWLFSVVGVFVVMFLTAWMASRAPSPSLSNKHKTGTVTPKTQKMSPEAEQRARERLEEFEYWIEPAKHFEVGGLGIYAGDRPGIALVLGRVKNVGERDCKYIQLNFRLLDGDGRQVGRAKQFIDDGIRSGESADVRAILVAHKPGGVEVRLDPEGIVAY